MPRTKEHDYGQLIFTEGCYYRKPAIQINKTEGSLFSHTFYKIHSKYIRDINIILESIILLAEKSEEKIYYLSLKDLIGHWRQAKIEGIDYIKV